ncbi:hypothetical protein RP75_21065 [Agrobacterium arsenijevicii]|uniref:Uncharacterized protein n=1 Tax=Agrobacterium arsenijevicii TaxID=1585697 RepID=A0ABR5D3I3_9HYPH|nr:hypothetical protein RP75_21065 [Agrobacterium arsenijevicii]
MFHLRCLNNNCRHHDGACASIMGFEGRRIASAELETEDMFPHHFWSRSSWCRDSEHYAPTDAHLDATG